MRTWPIVLVVSLLGLGCGASGRPSPQAADAPAGTQIARETYVDEARGLQVRVPAGWRVSPRILTPVLSSPREIIAMATGPMPVNRSGNMPTRTMAALGTHDVFVSVQERPAGTGHPDWDRADGASGAAASPPRPRRFLFRANPSWSQPEQANVNRRARFWWRDFADGDRNFYVLVGIGSAVTPRRRREVEMVADSLRFTPGETWGFGPWVRVPHGWSARMHDQSPTVRTITLRDPGPPAITVAVRLADSVRFGGPERTIGTRVAVTDLAGTSVPLRSAFGMTGHAEVTITSAGPIPERDREARVRTLNAVLESIRVASS